MQRIDRPEKTSSVLMFLINSGVTFLSFCIWLYACFVITFFFLSLFQVLFSVITFLKNKVTVVIRIFGIISAICMMCALFKVLELHRHISKIYYFFLATSTLLFYVLLIAESVANIVLAFNVKEWVHTDPRKQKRGF
jgi:hypothetical protein